MEKPNTMAGDTSGSDCLPDQTSSLTPMGPMTCALDSSGNNFTAESVPECDNMDEHFLSASQQGMSCRLCALVVSDVVERHGWVEITNQWFHSAETIDSIMNKYLPQGVLTDIPSEGLPKFVCSSCLSSLQLIKDFVDKIIMGQQKLKQIFHQSTYSHKLKSDGDNNEAHENADFTKPRKRGRPRKSDKKDSTVVKEKETCSSTRNVEPEPPRGKRACRPPARYGSEIYLTGESSDASTNPTHDCSQTEEKIEENTSTNQPVDCELTSLPETLTEVTVDEIQDNQLASCRPSSGDKWDLVNNAEKSSKAVDTKDIEMIASDDSNDANFQLGTFRRGRKPVKTRKRGRPKKRQTHDFKCDVCEKVYTAYASLVYHQLSHQENKQDFTCNVCKKKFAHKALLANHMFAHSSARPFICDEEGCNSSFKSRGSLFNHKKAFHVSSNGKPFTCEKCGLQFALKPTLQVHLKVHTGEKPYHCMYCDKSFSHRGNMKEHVRTHTKERPYVCDIADCGKSFTTSSQLRNHKMRHLVSKPFLCVECGKSFSQRAGLVYHMKSHKGELLKCSICHKDFTDDSALIKHQRMHSGEKPFHCAVCNKTFSDPSNFRKHKRTHEELKDDTLTIINSADPANGNLQNSSSASPFPVHMDRTDVIASAPSSFEIGEASTSEYEHHGADTGSVAETLVQILSPEELVTLSASASSSDGNIIFLYQPEDLFSVTVEENQTSEVPAENGETVVLQEVIEMGELESITTLPFETQEQTE